MQAFLFDYEPEGCITKAEAQGIISPFREKFASIWIGAQKDYLDSVTDHARSILGGLAQANCISDFAKHRVRSEFSNNDQIEFCNALGFFKVYISKKIVIRLKKLDANHLAMNAKSEQQQEWYANRPLPGINNSCTRLNLGYRNHPVEDVISDIIVSFQVSRNTLGWSFSIIDDADTLRIPVSGTSPNVPFTPAQIPLEAKGSSGRRKSKEG